MHLIKLLLMHWLSQCHFESSLSEESGWNTSWSLKLKYGNFAIINVSYGFFVTL